MLGLLVFSILLLVAVRCDTPAFCYNDQFLGEWTIKIGKAITPKVDKSYCPENIGEIAEVRHIRLESPNIAFDLDKQVFGTWFAVYTNGFIARVGDEEFFINARWEVNPPGMKKYTTHCDESQPGFGTYTKMAVGYGEYSCISGKNTKPVLNKVTNNHDPNEPGPVNSKIDEDDEFGIYMQNLVPHRLPVSSDKMSVSYGGLPETDGGDLPTTFLLGNVDGKNYLPEVSNQASCGSCYLFATVQAMMARVMYKSKGADRIDGRFDGTRLSFEHPLTCANGSYAQLCKGGFNNLVLKQAREYGVLLEKDYRPYIEKAADRNEETDKCTAEVFSKLEDRYFFTAGQPLGGSMGLIVSPKEIKYELYRNGAAPVSVMVDSPSTGSANSRFRNCHHTLKVQFYESADWTQVEENQLTEQQKRNAISDDDYEVHNLQLTEQKDQRHYYYHEANHSVLLTGWKRIYYLNRQSGDVIYVDTWQIMNSWGKWCTNGFSFIKMGRNEFAIESEVDTFLWVEKPNVNPSKTKSNGDSKVVVVVLGILMALFVIATIVLAILYGLKVRAAKKRSYVNLDTEKEPLSLDANNKA